MGRRAEGYRVTWKRGWAYCRFTWKGKDYRVPLGTKDKSKAREEAPGAYADIVSGRYKPAVRKPGVQVGLSKLLEDWLETKRTSLHPRTFETIESYAQRYCDSFGELDRITEASGSAYGRARLGQVLRTSVIRELSYLREFLRWCKMNGHLDLVPEIPRLPPKATGVRAGKHRAKYVHITAKEAAAIIALLPEESKTIDGRKWPVRARFAFAWETSLRPGTISRLSVPEHWRPGATHLDIAPEIDKTRFGREVDLTPEAIALLTALAPAKGLIFGSSNFAKAIKRAAKAVLGEDKGAKFAPYDFRHGRLKDLLDAGAIIRGVSWIAGHLRASTTDKYLAPDRKAGAQALEAARKKPPHKRPRSKGDDKKPG